MSERRAGILWWFWLVAGLVAVALVAALVRWWQPLYQFVSDQEQVRTWIQNLGPWGPLAISLLEMTQALLAPIPGQAIEAVSGYLYGPFWGILFPMVGMFAGSTVIFFLSRRFGRPLAVRLVGKRSMARLDDLVRRGGAPFFFLIWLLPFAPDDLACVAAGLTPMPTRQFLILMLLGRLPGVAVSVWVGANVARIDPIWWAVLFALIALVALAFWRWGDRIQESILQFIEKLSKRLDRST